MEGLYNRRIVRTFIIDGSDRQSVVERIRNPQKAAPNGARRIDSFASKKKVPVIAIVIK